MFDVLLEGVEAFPSLDIYKEVGANTALTKIANVNVKDGFLTIEFRAIIENVSLCRHISRSNHLFWFTSHQGVGYVC